MVSNQAFLFIVFTVNGITIGVVFDFFRILRRIFKTIDFITYIEDVLFWIITGLIILYSMCTFCDGELRFFMLLGIAMGVLLYMITISKYVIKITTVLLTFIKNLCEFPFKIIYKFTKKIVFRPIRIICINLRNKMKKNVKKYKGFFKEKAKYNNV